MLDSQVLNDGDIASLIEALKDPFGGAQPVFVSDSQDILRPFKERGVPALTFAEVEGSTLSHQSVFAITVEGGSTPPLSAWNRLFTGSTVLMLPLLAFDNSIPAGMYTLKVLSRSDFKRAVEHNVFWLNRMMDAREPFDFVGPGTTLRCELGDDLTIMKPQVNTELEPGAWEAIGGYFEVGLVPQAEQLSESLRPGFDVSGTVLVPGVAVAHHRHMRSDLVPLARRAWERLSSLQAEGRFPLKVQVERSQVVSVTADGMELWDELRELTNATLDMVLTEMAVSTNVGLGWDVLDLSVNSQMNEGSTGIHLGIGDGVTGAHIDLICPGVHE